MAKDNLFLGYARGKVGSVVFYRAKGEQITRSLNAAPSNPQTALQLLQRVCFKSSSVAYSLFAPITDHSFEGVEAGTPSQSRFAQRNIALMRAQLADVINSGDEEEILTSAESNFATKADTLPPFRSYVMSEGHAPEVSPILVATAADESLLALPGTWGSSPTYNDVINTLGLQRGDQLTFLFLSIDDTTDSHAFNGFHFARVILEPANGDFTTPFVSGGVVNSPNARNQGILGVLISEVEETTYLSFSAGAGGRVIISDTAGLANTLAAVGVIVSRQVGNTWQRSNCKLLLRSDVTTVQGHLQWDHSTGYLADAIASFKTTGAVSTAYLNQAQKAASADD